MRTAGRVVVELGATLCGPGNGISNVTHFAVFDAQSGGNMLGSNALASGGGAIPSGAAVSFAAGALA